MLCWFPLTMYWTLGACPFNSLRNRVDWFKTLISLLEPATLKNACQIQRSCDVTASRIIVGTFWSPRVNWPFHTVGHLSHCQCMRSMLQNIQGKPRLSREGAGGGGKDRGRGRTYQENLVSHGRAWEEAGRIEAGVEWRASRARAHGIDGMKLASPPQRECHALSNGYGAQRFRGHEMFSFFLLLKLCKNLFFFWCVTLFNVYETLIK
jgi:hypothetical protein